MESRSRPAAVPLIAVTIALTFLALLGTWNEIRFQGCVARQDRQIQLQLDSHWPGHVVTCSRVPFK